MSKQDVYIVVGDGYKDFARHGNVLTAETLRQRLTSPDQWSGAESIVLGLGLGHSEKRDLQRGLSACDISWRASWSETAAGRLTHKVSEENALISPPRRLGPGLFEFDFVLSDVVDRLSDHITGQHVGAIPLMEAARQAGIAVLEMAFLGDAAERHGLVVDAFDTKFRNYVFPLPTILRVHVNEVEPETSPRRVLLTVEVVQGGKVCCDIRLDVRMFASAVLEQIEARSAKKALEATLVQWGRP